MAHYLQPCSRHLSCRHVALFNSICSTCIVVGFISGVLLILLCAQSLFSKFLISVFLLYYRDGFARGLPNLVLLFSTPCLEPRRKTLVTIMQIGCSFFFSLRLSKSRVLSPHTFLFSFLFWLMPPVFFFSGISLFMVPSPSYACVRTAFPETVSKLNTKLEKL